MSLPMLQPEQHWECPNCDLTAVTHETRPHTEFHHCAGLRSLWAPLIPAGTRAKVEAVEREDYVGRDQAQTDRDGRPVMAVVTTRDDGMDCAVLVPCAIDLED